MQKRRELLLALGMGFAAAPFPSLGQTTGKVWRIGLLHVGTDHMPPAYDALRAGMRALGYEEGRNIRYDFRNLEDYPAAREAARSFVRSSFDLVIAFDTEACKAAFAEIRSIPVVLMHAVNPVAAGYAKSLAHPGGNFTGFAGIPELPGKETQILKELKPRLAKVLLLVDTGDPGSLRWRDEAREAASKLRVTLVERSAQGPEDIKHIFGSLKRDTAEAVVFAAAGIRHRNQSLVLDLAAKHGLPVVGSRKDWVERGALFSYNYDYLKVGRIATGRYVDQILKGAKPADLPIEEVTEYQLVVNRKTAQRYGLTIPQSVMILASELLE